MDVQDISSMALALAVAGIVIAFSLLVMTEIQSETCPSLSTYGSYASSNHSNLITGTTLGCCAQINATDAAICDHWTYGAAFNASEDSIEGVGEFSDWFVIIALAIVFAIIIGIIVK